MSGSADPRLLVAAIADAISASVPPLVRRLRGRVAQDIATALVETGAVGISFLEAGPDDRRLSLIAALRLFVERIERGVETSRREHAAWEKEFARAANERERRELVRRRLRETVSDRRQLRGDLRAVERHLGRDVLMERHDAEVHGALARIELALSFLGIAAEGMLLDAGDDDLADRRDSLIVQLDLVGFLNARFVGRERWQNRLAAVEALARILRPLARRGVIPESISRGPLGTAERCADDEDEHPWVRGGALQLVLTLSRAEAIEALEKRMFDPKRSESGRAREGRDFLVRRLAVDLAPELPPAVGLELLDGILEARDPSEHVRIGLCNAFAALSHAGGLSRLRSLAGLGGEREASERVRASAVIEARKAASLALASPFESRTAARDVTGIMHVKTLEQQSVRLSRRREESTGELTIHGRARIPASRNIAARTPIDARVRDTFALLLDVLASERDPMATEIACEELSRLFVDLAAGGHDGEVAARATTATRALLAIRANPEHPPMVHEAASAAAEVIERERDPVRRAWTEFLRLSVAGIAPGSAGTIRLRDLPAILPPFPEDPLFLGRILADLSRRSWGLGATQRPGALKVWRGEHFKTRLWRILHELRAPSPNKRMNIEHTSGRIYPGELRAHPGWMEEITATVVPGERVFVDHEGGWGRHLPTVDDLLQVATGVPVRIFSSHGMTVVEEPPAIGTRLRKYVDVSWRYAPLTGTRLASLAAVEPRERRAYLAHVEESWGLTARFVPFPYPSVDGWHRTVSPHLRSLFPADPAPLRDEEGEGAREASPRKSRAR